MMEAAVNQQVSSVLHQLGTSGLSFLLPIAIVLMAWLFIAVMWGRIFGKAGYPGWYGVVAFVPGVNIVALIYFAFARWPIEREMQELTDRFGLNWRR